MAHVKTRNFLGIAGSLLFLVAPAWAESEYNPALCAQVDGTLDIYWERLGNNQVTVCEGIEFTDGTLADAADGRVTMNGISVSNEICISRDSYTFTVTPDKLTLDGVADSGGQDIKMVFTRTLEEGCFVGHWFDGAVDYRGHISASPFLASSNETLFVPLEPCRVFDTRVVGGPFGGGQTRDYWIWGNGLAEQQGGTDDCGVPNGVAAVHLNFTAVNPVGFGYLRAWPFEQDEPQATLMAFNAGPGISNATALSMCDICASDISVKIYGAPTHLVTEVVGYYLPLTSPIEIEPPGLISPPNGGLQPNNCNGEMIWSFDWSDVPGATQYHIFAIHPGSFYQAIDKSVEQSELVENFGDSSIADPLISDWIWHVRAKVGDLWSDWSSEGSFDVKPLSDPCL